MFFLEIRAQSNCLLLFGIIFLTIQNKVIENIVLALTDAEGEWFMNW